METPIDAIIAPIATNVRTCADEILSLREAVLAGAQPGTCVACYFKILGVAARHRREAVVTPLRQWLEQHLEVVAQNEADTVLERFPVVLDEADLESYCQGVMRTFHFDRSYEIQSLSLRFEYKVPCVA